jgi:hypothetical protein
MLSYKAGICYGRRMFDASAGNRIRTLATQSFPDTKQNCPSAVQTVKVDGANPTGL